ncbi:MAG: sigma-70 family RNA polymerase sigma factor [Planctomycetaceae bacterium]|nr:MAG: sigma-70 family RNA polymerase sigma factor [Planctomycetaceae bacterium]
MDDSLDFSQRVRGCAQRISESGPAALGGLYDLTAVRLVRYSVTITRNQHDAEDAVQATLVRVADSPRTLDRAEQPWAYLLRMVRNESLVILRRKRRWTSLLSLSDLLTRRGVDEVEHEETYREIWTALRTLPTEQSEVVVLKIWEAMTFAQIADVLDVAPATAASRYRYALDKLARKLGPLPEVAQQRSEVGHGD